MFLWNIQIQVSTGRGTLSPKFRHCLSWEQASRILSTRRIKNARVFKSSSLRNCNYRCDHHLLISKQRTSNWPRNLRDVKSTQFRYDKISNCFWKSFAETQVGRLSRDFLRMTLRILRRGCYFCSIFLKCSNFRRELLCAFIIKPFLGTCLTCCSSFLPCNCLWIQYYYPNWLLFNIFMFHLEFSRWLLLTKWRSCNTNRVIILWYRTKCCFKITHALCSIFWHLNSCFKNV